MTEGGREGDFVVCLRKLTAVVIVIMYLSTPLMCVHLSNKMNVQLTSGFLSYINNDVIQILNFRDDLASHY